MRAEYGKALNRHPGRRPEPAPQQGLEPQQPDPLPPVLPGVPRPGDEKCDSATLSHQLTWSHIVELLKIDDPLERGFNERQALHERWSVRELVRQKAYVFEFLKIPEPYHAGIEYATYGMSSQLFVQKYELYLPDREALRRELEETLRQAGQCGDPVGTLAAVARGSTRAQ